MLEFDDNHKSADNLSEKIAVIKSVVSEEKIVIDGETINVKDIAKAIKVENDLVGIFTDDGVHENEEENEIKRQSKSSFFVAIKGGTNYCIFVKLH